jgi:hypothetical protein
MDAIVKNLVHIIKKKRYRYVSIAETNHRSHDSHVFQLKLLKAIHKHTNINHFSAEGITLIDAFFLNRWIDGRLKCSLETLYSFVPCGGTGVYNWLPYFKECRNNGIPFKLVGIEGDTYLHSYNGSNKILEYLQLFVSRDVFEMYKMMMDKPNLDLFPLVPKSEDDREIMQALNHYISMNLAGNMLNVRYKMWEDHIFALPNLYIVGFHMGKGGEVRMPPKTLYLGMTAKDRMIYANTVSPTVYLQNVNYIWDYFMDKLMDQSKAKPRLLSKFINETEITKKAKDFDLIKTKGKSGTILGFGRFPVPYVPGYKINLKIAEDDVHTYDYIVCIKMSRLNKDIRK